MLRFGAGVTVNVPPVVVPTELVMAMTPVVAEFGTMAVIEPLFATVKIELTPLNFTAVEEKKFDPVMVTVVPTGPLAGVNPLMVGAEPGLMLVVSVSELSAVFGSPWSATTLPVATSCPA